MSTLNFSDWTEFGGAGFGGASFQTDLLVEEISNFEREGGGGFEMGCEVGTSIGTTEEAGGFIVCCGSLFRCLEGSQPHSDIMGCVFDLCHPFPRGPLSDTNEAASTRSVLAFPNFAA